MQRQLAEYNIWMNQTSISADWMWNPGLCLTWNHALTQQHRDADDCDSDGSDVHLCCWVFAVCRNITVAHKQWEGLDWILALAVRDIKGELMIARMYAALFDQPHRCTWEKTKQNRKWYYSGKTDTLFANTVLKRWFISITIVKLKPPFPLYVSSQLEV